MRYITLIKFNKYYNIDCLELTKQVDNESIDLIIIDPPYTNVVDADWDKNENPMTQELLTEFFRILKPTGSLYCWCGIGEKSQSLIRFFELFDKSNFYFKDLITWKKNRGIGMRKGWLYTREEILWYVKDNKKFIWNKKNQYSDEKRPWNVYKKGGKMVNKSEYKRLTNVWADINEVGYGGSPKTFHDDRNKVNHITPKPIEAIDRIIQLHTKECDIVFDCFCGSGVVGKSCIKNNRNFICGDNDKDCINRCTESILK